MPGYRLWVEDHKGRSVNVAHPSHNRDGVECFKISENTEFCIVLEHATCTTYFVVDKDGDITIEQS